MDRTIGLRADQTIRLTGVTTQHTYPAALRCVRHYDAAIDKRFTFLTNNFLLPAFTIAQLYRSRWNIEVFFKWIKQHLRIKSFYGNSENAVKTQIWIAIGVYVLVAIAKKTLAGFVAARCPRIWFALRPVLPFNQRMISEGFQNHMVRQDDPGVEEV